VFSFDEVSEIAKEMVSPCVIIREPLSISTFRDTVMLLAQ
jgi:hypothetical protein